jgi:hypothetical protein
MTTKLDQTPKEKLAAATRAQHRAKAGFQAASDALQRFAEQHPVLDAALSKERESLIIAEAQAAEALREAKDIFDFCHHEHYAMSQNWGRSSGKWFRGDKRHEDRG